jgi:hypothetical protein
MPGDWLVRFSGGAERREALGLPDRWRSPAPTDVHETVTATVADLVATISVAASGTVAIVVPFVNERLTRGPAGGGFLACVLMRAGLARHV